MNFKSKLIAFHTLAVALATISAPALADEIKLNYKDFDLDTPQAQKIWANESNTAEPLGDTKPWAAIAHVKIKGLKDITVSQLFASNECGAQSCPIKVMQGDKVITNDLACDSNENHFISDDGKYLIACDAVIPINPK